MPDLIIARGIYINALNGMKKRISKFNESKDLFNNMQYSISCFWEIHLRIRQLYLDQELD